MWLIDAMMKLAWLFLAPSVNTDFDSRKLWVGINLAGSAAAGIISDDILQKGWDHIDEHDLRTWLRRHGANRITLDSGPVRARRWRRRRARARRLLRAHRHLG